MLVTRTHLGVLGAVVLLGCTPFAPASQPPNVEVPVGGPVAVAPGARRLVCQEGERLRLHDAVSGELLAESDELKREGTRGLALSPDGRRVVVSTYGARLLGFEQRGEHLDLTARITAASATFQTAPVFGPRGALAIARAEAVDLWPDGDLRTPPLSVDVGEGVRDLAFRPVDGLLAVAFGDRVEVWDVLAGTRRERLGGLPGRHVSFGPNGEVASGDLAIVVRTAGGATRTLEGPVGCTGLAWNRQGTHVGCVGAERAWVCDDEGCSPVSPQAGQHPFTFVVPSPEGLFFGAGDGRLVDLDGAGVRRQVFIDGLFDRTDTRP